MTEHPMIFRSMNALHQQTETPAAPRAASATSSLNAQRSALTSELTSLTIQRDLLGQQLRNATGESAAALQAQLQRIDARVKANSADMERIDEAIHKAVTSNLPGDAPLVPSGSDIARMIQSAVGTIPGTGSASAARMDRMEKMVLGLGALNGLGIVLMAMLLWRSMRWPRGASRGADAAQLEQLQRAVDVIAVEVERISEGQRFVAKALGGDRVTAGPADRT